jgi:hypothetical protein
MAHCRTVPKSNRKMKKTILDFGTDSVSIIWFSMGLWNYFHSVALSIYLLDIGTDQTFWYDWFFYGTLELY